jgi:hypothetical protein
MRFPEEKDTIPPTPGTEKINIFIGAFFTKNDAAPFQRVTAPDVTRNAAV